MSPAAFPLNDNPRVRFERRSPRLFFRASRARTAGPGYEMSRAFFSHTSLKFIPIINSGARALRIPRLCEAAATDKCIAVRTYVYISTYIRLVRETGFPYVLISRRHRRNSVYTDTPSFLTRASLSLARLTHDRARFRILADKVYCHTCRMKSVRSLARSEAFTTAIFFILDCLDASSIRNYLQAEIEM